MFARLTLLFLCLGVQACLLPKDKASSEKNIDSTTNASGARLNIELEKPCLTDTGPANADFKTILNEKMYIKPELTDCPITVRKHGAQGEDVMSTNLRTVASTIKYFCPNSTPPPLHVRDIREMGLCEAARDALGGFILNLQVTELANPKHDIDDVHTGNKKYLEDCYQPDLIDVAKIPRKASEFIELYPNNCSSDIPIRAYMTYIYSHLHDLMTINKALDKALNRRKILQQQFKKYSVMSVMRSWYDLKHTQRFDDMFIIGNYTRNLFSNYKKNPRKLAKYTYWKVCFKIVKRSIEKQGIATTALTGNFYRLSLPFKPEEVYEYNLFDDYITKYVIGIDDAKAQLEEVKDKMLKGLDEAISAAGKSKAEIAETVSKDIKEYIDDIKQPRDLVLKVGFPSYLKK